jgi:hypothetical protein
MAERHCCWTGCWSSAAALASWAITISIVVDDIMMNFNQIGVVVVVLAR